MQKLCKPLFFCTPFLVFLILGQLHTIPQAAFSVLYTIFAAYYCFSKPENFFLQKLTKYQNEFKIGSAITIGIIFIIYSLPIGGLLSKKLVLPHSTEKADAVLVLASGSTLYGDPGYAGYQRVLHGAKLLKSGQAKHLYISTGFDKTFEDFREYDWVASLTRLLEIPADKVTIFKSKDIITTATEAQYAKKQLEAQNINRILLTTSGSHIRRSVATFRKAGFEVLPAPCHTSESIVFADRYIIAFHAAVHEWVGLAWYWLMGRI